MGAAELAALPAHTESKKPQAVRAAIVVSLAGVVVKLASTGKEVFVASTYGRSDELEAYLAAFLIPNLLINLIAESMNQALIPTLIRVRLQQGQACARRLLSSSALSICIMLASTSLGMGLCARALFPLLFRGFSPVKLTLTIHLFYALLPCVLLGGIASNATAVLNTLESFGFPALTGAIIPIMIVCCTMAFHSNAGIWALALATVIGTATQASLLLISLRVRGCSLRLRWMGGDDTTREVTRQFGPVLLSSVVASGGLVVDQAMAAMLPSGSIAAIVFAGRFVSVALALLGGSLSSALSPHFSDLVARRDWLGCSAALHSWSRRAFLLSTPIAILLIGGARPLVHFTLQHGAFAAHDTRVVASVLAMSAIQIPFFVVSRVPYRLVIAMRRADLVLYCGVLNLVADVVLNLMLMRTMGVAGIALSTSLWTVSTCVFFWLCARRLLVARLHGQPS